ncbi:hypothetical protein ACJDU8_23355 [Clostridium sp. WILCCON 0269]|uniref:Transposase n=1 Tax=Candidatus Clostridium eludens TaxID=3381663 RepID=A0ABW8STR1_9CLOT
MRTDVLNVLLESFIFDLESILNALKLITIKTLNKIIGALSHYTRGEKNEKVSIYT